MTLKDELFFYLIKSGIIFQSGCNIVLSTNFKMEYLNTSYIGDMKDGRYYNLTVENLKKIFCKMFAFSRFEGNGNYNFSTGTKYEGELKDGCFHGKGTLLFENGAKYVANWNEGIASDVYLKLKNQLCQSFV